MLHWTLQRGLRYRHILILYVLLYRLMVKRSLIYSTNKLRASLIVRQTLVLLALPSDDRGVVVFDDQTLR